jgi:Kdo2-lipid IVA lauroyltransferase/acyltransferase
MSRASLSHRQVEAIQAGRLARIERARRLGLGKRISHRLQAWVTFGIVGLLRLLPVDAASGLGGWIGRRFLSRRLATDAVKRTIRVAFPNADEVQIAAIIAEMSDNIVRVVTELARVNAFAGRNNPRLVVEGVENLEAARAGGRGVLFALGHLANWEVAGIPLRNLGIDGVFAVMPPTNPHVFDWLARLRLSVGLSEQANAGEGVYKAFRRNLREGRVAILLADQRLANGIKAPFFGVETTTNVIPARLARTLGVAVVPLAVRRVAGKAAHFTVSFLPPLEFVGSGDVEADEKVFTTRVNAFYENEIRNAPGQWLWVDPRWEEI